MSGPKDYMKEFERMMEPLEREALPTEADIKKLLKRLHRADTPRNRRWAAEQIQQTRSGETPEL